MFLLASSDCCDSIKYSILPHNLTKFAELSFQVQSTYRAHSNNKRYTPHTTRDTYTLNVYVVIYSHEISHLLDESEHFTHMYVYIYKD